MFPKLIKPLLQPTQFKLITPKISQILLDRFIDYRTRVIKSFRKILPSEFFRPKEFVDAINRDANDLITNHSLKNNYNKECALRYARKKKYETTELLRLIENLRLRRQKILKAAHVNLIRDPLRSIRFFRFSFQLQREMEDIFVEIYKYNGDIDLLKEVSCARFATGKLLGRMSAARGIQRKREDALVEMYRQSGDKNLLDEVRRTRFATGNLLQRMKDARRQQLQKERDPF